jgi:hypothetical protein
MGRLIRESVIRMSLPHSRGRICSTLFVSMEGAPLNTVRRLLVDKCGIATSVNCKLRQRFQLPTARSWLPLVYNRRVL